VSAILNAIPLTDTWKIKERNQNRKQFKVWNCIIRKILSLRW
jgi:hypothetical protein